MRGDYSRTSRQATEAFLSPQPKPAILLSHAIAEFVAEHDASRHWRKKSKEESEAIYRLLVGILGDVPMSELDYKALSGWRNAILRFPSNYTKRPSLRGKTIAEIASVDSGATKPHQSVTSVNKMLTQTGAFLKWSIKRGYCGANYCEGLTIRRRDTKEAEEREAYSKEDLLRLVRSPLYGEPKTAKERRDRTAHPERQWLPLLGLYMGARINELCQLHVADIFEEDGVLCVDINDKGEGKRLKNASSRRVIPVHPIPSRTWIWEVCGGAAEAEGGATLARAEVEARRVGTGLRQAVPALQPEVHFHESQAGVSQLPHTGSARTPGWC